MSTTDMEVKLTQQRRNILGQARRRGYVICGAHSGQSITLARELIQCGLLTGHMVGDTLYAQLSGLGRRVLSETNHG